MFAALALYLLAINLWAFAAFGLDKRAAERRRPRTPERRLLWLAAIGGTPGALTARQVFRHKTRKEPFSTRLWMIAGVQGLTLAALAVQAFRAR
jgi:uncharacterized membrane protein YsdA (DUF1294 family)